MHTRSKNRHRTCMGDVRWDGRVDWKATGVSRAVSSVLGGERGKRKRERERERKKNCIAEARSYMYGTCMCIHPFVYIYVRTHIYYNVPDTKRDDDGVLERDLPGSASRESRCGLRRVSLPVHRSFSLSSSFSHTLVLSHLPTWYVHVRTYIQRSSFTPSGVGPFVVAAAIRDCDEKLAAFHTTEGERKKDRRESTSPIFQQPLQTWRRCTTTIFPFCPFLSFALSPSLFLFPVHLGRVRESTTCLTRPFHSPPSLSLTPPSRCVYAPPLPYHPFGKHPAVDSTSGGDGKGTRNSPEDPRATRQPTNGKKNKGRKRSACGYTAHVFPRETNYRDRPITKHDRIPKYPASGYAILLYSVSDIIANIHTFNNVSFAPSKILLPECFPSQTHLHSSPFYFT